MSGKYALIVGNTEYVDHGLAQLTAPGNDAEDFARILKDPNICGFDDVKVLMNQLSSKVNEAIDEFFDQKKPDDTLVLYFSGHGIRDEFGALYLAVKNTIRSRLRSTAIKSDYVRDVMDQSRAKRQVLILDCCNSGAFEQGTKAATGVSIGTASAFQAGYGRIVLTASDANQYAWEGDKVIGETNNSLFTHYLVEGLEGDADRDGDGCITVDELYDYAYDKVKLATPKQTPSKFSSKQQGEIILRQFTSVENIKPALLPDELLEAISDSRIFVREGAVQQLGQLLNGKHLGLARSAREALQRIAREDDSRQVSRAATQILEANSQKGLSDTRQRKAISRAAVQTPSRTAQPVLSSIQQVRQQHPAGPSAELLQRAFPVQQNVTQGTTPYQAGQKDVLEKAAIDARTSLKLSILSLVLSPCGGIISIGVAFLAMYFAFRGLGSSRKADALIGLALSGLSVLLGIAATAWWFGQIWTTP
jgi:uncharacterized caspase-like protein